MIYFNSDGSRAAMCGNAALCSTTLAVHLGMATADGMELETDAATYRSRPAGAEAGEGRAQLHLAPVAAPAPVAGLALAAGERRVALASVGVPHLVVLVDDVGQLDLPTRGRALRFDPALGPSGANVNFISKASGEAPWRMKTYERGVEGETLACGTGSVAAACALQEWGLERLPVHIRTRSGRLLTIDARHTTAGRYEDVWLAGEGRMVFKGVLT